MNTNIPSLSSTLYRLEETDIPSLSSTLYSLEQTEKALEKLRMIIPKNEMKNGNLYRESMDMAWTFMDHDQEMSEFAERLDIQKERIMLSLERHRKEISEIKSKRMDQVNSPNSPGSTPREANGKSSRKLFRYLKKSEKDEFVSDYYNASCFKHTDLKEKDLKRKDKLRKLAASADVQRTHTEQESKKLSQLEKEKQIKERLAKLQQKQKKLVIKAKKNPLTPEKEIDHPAVTSPKKVLSPTLKEQRKRKQKALQTPKRKPKKEKLTPLQQAIKEGHNWSIE